MNFRYTIRKDKVNNALSFNFFWFKSGIKIKITVSKEFNYEVGAEYKATIETKQPNRAIQFKATMGLFREDFRQKGKGVIDFTKVIHSILNTYGIRVPKSAIERINKRLIYFYKEHSIFI